MGAPGAAPQVDAHELFVPGHVGHVFQQRVGRHAGVVDQGVDAPKLGHRVGDQAPAGVFLAHVGGAHQHLGAQLPALLGHLFKLVGATGGQHQGQLAG